MDDLTATGFKVIRDMTREEMLAELLAYQRRILEPQETMQLRSYIATARLEAYKKRLLDEAGLRETGGLLGGLVATEDSDDD